MDYRLEEGILLITVYYVILLSYIVTVYYSKEETLPSAMMVDGLPIILASKEITKKISKSTSWIQVSSILLR